MKKVISLALLSSTLAFAQAGIMGGSEGLHQINARTQGQWQVNIGTGGNISIGSWGLSRGGVYEMRSGGGTYQKYSFNGADYSQAGNIFVSVGVLDFIDIGASLPLYYEHANSNGPSGSSNMWTTSRGDLDLFAKVGLPFASSKSGFFLPALMLDLYVPTGEIGAGVRPRHVWYLNGRGYTHPFTADEFVLGAGFALTFDFTKKGAPITWNAAASYVYPINTDQTNTLVYSTGVNWLFRPWMTPFFEFSGEMRLQSKGRYSFDPLVDPMLFTPGVRFHLPYNVEFAIGLDVAVRALREFSFKSGITHKRDVKGGKDYQIYYVGENNYNGKYGYASTPLLSGSALLSIALDATGKSKDSDGDGVIDSKDKCARTPKDVKVNEDGCPAEDLAAKEKAYNDSLAKIDTDNDGIPDVKDKCPNTIPGTAVDSIGCMQDFDKDGISDNQDKCPNTEAGVPVNASGCPLDFDNDGVPDYLDKCPNTPSGVVVDSKGCILDSDNDGIPDFKDKCPGTPSGNAVDTLGCLHDVDKDGVADILDKCPNTLPGIQVDANGCPVNKKEDLNQLKKGVQFKTGSTKLAKSSYGTLNDIAKLMKKYTSVNLEVQGHTDNKGSEKKNKKLSETRANAVVKYLIKKGVAKDRLRAVGYGSEMPIADNNTAEGRAENRRVELVPFTK